MRANEVLEVCGGLLRTGGDMDGPSYVRCGLGRGYISRKWCLDAAGRSWVFGKREIKSWLIEEV